MIGCGNMGGAMLTGWLDKKSVSAVTIITPSGSPKFASHELVTAYTSVDALPTDAKFDAILLAVKPQMMDDVLPAYKHMVSSDTVFVTVAAGKPISYYENMFGADVHLVRAMPNTPSAIGQGVTLVTANDNVTDAQYQSVQKLLSASGTVEPLANEEILDKATTISGCGPAYVALFVETLTQAGVSIGLDEKLAERLAMQTVIGSGVMLDSIDLPIAQQRQNVTSKGGVTAAALEIMMRDGNGMAEVMSQALQNAMKRTKELQG